MSSSPPRPTKRTKTGQASLTAFFGARSPPTLAAAVSQHPEKNHHGVVVGEEGSPALAKTGQLKKSQRAAPKEPDGDPRSDVSSLLSLQEKKEDSLSSSSSPSPSPSSNSLLDPIVPQMVRWSESRWLLYKDCVMYRRGSSNGEDVVASGSGGRAKVAAFDLDGTLLTWRTPAGGWPSALSDYELWNGSVITKLQQLYDEENYQLVVISNQGGIRKALKGKIATKVKNLTEWLIATIDRPVSVIMSTSKNSGYHKPSVELWDLAQRLFCHTHSSSSNSNNNEKKSSSPTTTWNVAESFYVGDSVLTAGDPQGGVDETLARNVSDKYHITLKFHTPTDFFGPSTNELRNRQQQGSMGGDEAAAPPAATTLQERARWHSGDIIHSGRQQRPILLLLCGAQGSGKSTFAQRLSTSFFQHISQDTIRNGQAGTRQQVEAAVRGALSSSSPPRSVVLDRMHLDAAQRAIFIDIARECGNVPVHTLTFDLPAAVSAQRVLARRDHLVTGESGARLAQQSAGRLVRPRWDEGIVLCHTITHPAMVDRFVNLYNGKIEIPTHFPIVAAAAAHTATTSEVLRMPSVILGTMGLGRRIAAETVAHALDLGIAGIDTAPTYKNEDLVLPNNNNGSDVFCIVKVPKRAVTAADVAAELDASLAKLRRDRADLLLLHWPAGETTKTLWSAMEAVARAGKAQALGVCNFNVAALSHLLSFCAIRPSVVQIERHPRLAQWDMVDFCCQHDIQLQAHTPLGQGLIVEDEIVRGIAKKYSSVHAVVSPAQVALAWNLQQGVAVVPKCATRAHQQELRTIVPLSSDDLMTLNDLSRTKPQRFVAPPFMYGSADFCWAARFPKPTTT